MNSHHIPANEDAQLEEWLSLHEASELLGVALSTLRRWGDTGRVPVRRTLGGHRRFQRIAILRLLEAPAGESPSAAAHSWGVDDHQLAHQEWHARFAAGLDPEQMRGLGQRLLGVLMQYINRRDHDQRFLAEARLVSTEYGREAHRAGVSMYDTMEAFVFFRRSFAHIAQPVGNASNPARLIELHERLDRFMEVILLATIAGYEGLNPVSEH